MTNPEVEEIGPDDDQGIEAFRPKPKSETSRKLLEMRTGGVVKPIVPNGPDQLLTLSKMIYASRLAPKELTADQIAVCIMFGAEIGLLPMQSLSGIAVINGRPSVWGAVAMALVRRSGLMESIKEWIEDTVVEVEAADENGELTKRILPERTAHCLIKRIDEEPYESTFSISDARTAGLWGKNIWKSYPDRMLKMRARGFAFRDVFADVLAGLYLREEAQDMEPLEPIDVTPPLPETSGLAARLPGTPQTTGFSESHVEQEMGLKEQLEASLATEEGTE